MPRTKRQRISGKTEEELHASTVAALKAEMLRLFGKPLEELSKEELAAALPDGLEVGTENEDTARYVAEVGLGLGIPMHDPTLEISEPFESEARGAPTMQMEQTLLNLYVLRDGKRIARRGQPGTPQAGTWVSMVPGLHAFDLDDGIIEVRGVDATAH
jgi:hypothetical protein